MSVEFKKGNIFSSEAQVLFCPVNCRATMGAGLAKDFANRYLGLAQMHRDLCKKGEMKIGKIALIDTGTPQKVLFFPTKDNWVLPSKIEYIEEGMKAFHGMLLNFFVGKRLGSFAIPKLGCGLGGLNWYKEVRPLLLNYLQSDLINNTTLKDIVFEIWE